MQRHIPCTVKQMAPGDTPTTILSPGLPLKRTRTRTAKSSATVDSPAPVPSVDQPLPKRTRAGTTKRSAPVDSSTAVLSADLPPPPKRMRTEAPEIDADTMKKREKDFDREIRTAVSKAKENMVVMTAFDFDRAAANKKQLKANIPSHVWMDDTPRMAVSNDGVPLVIHLPQAMKEASTVHFSIFNIDVGLTFVEAILFTQLLDLVDNTGKLPRVAGADCIHRNAAASYKIVPGEMAGVFKITKAWHAIGHEHEAPTVAKHMLNTGKAFAASLNLIHQLRLVSIRVNAMLKYADPVHSAECEQLRKEAEACYYFLQVIGADDPLQMEGRELMYNRHPDKSDHKNGWAVLVVWAELVSGPLV
ncbi:hypothetical protein B0H13DRAFT_2300741 [Mycena leptocephala]|nr:hypothetical protein B0H13DRAFT_2300741 [Mycena leptocephala]